MERPTTTTTRAKRAASLASALAVAMCLTGAKPTEPGIYFHVSELRSSKGRLRCGLFTDSDNWLSEQPHESAEAHIRNGKATCVFKKVKPSVYALTALHDEDDNGAMTKSLFGLPEEGYVASGGAAREGVGRPDWNDARFRYDGAVLHRRARILYR